VPRSIPVEGESFGVRPQKVYVAGHRGLVGSAIVRALLAHGWRATEVLTRSRDELDLTDGRAVDEFFAREEPHHVYLAAAKVGGIRANSCYPADFIRENLAIQMNVINASHRHGVDRLLFLGSSCIYPRLAAQPMSEAALLTGSLEPSNRPYAIAKIAGIEACWSYNRQYGTRYFAAMPSNLYGPGDNYHPEDSHVIPALLRRFHDAAASGDRRVVIWGTGTPRREFMYSDEAAEACVHLMTLPDAQLTPLLAAKRSDGTPPIVNVGSGEEVTIAELANMIAQAVGYRGKVEFDLSKPDGAPRKLLDCSRLATLGWRARTPLKSGLGLTYEAFRARELVRV
jgi:GDP-L-fucose synthase